MKLSSFIKEHLEEILTGWEDFARTLQPAASAMSVAELRDHARQILQEISLNIEIDETAEQKDEKSKGNAPSPEGESTAASIHGALREVSGFSMSQLIAEYRAIRASVLRLWMEKITNVTKATSNEMLRFNEAIDQALAESAMTFSEQTGRTRDTFLAMLGHDLRSPLATMTMAGESLTIPETDKERTLQIGVRVKRSAVTMTNMVNDLLEYARTQLGGKMPIKVHPVEIRKICRSSMDDASAAHPECVFELHTSGDLVGDFDGARLQQVFANLLNNAAQYRGQEQPVTIDARGEPDAVIIEVRNRGPVIPPESLQAIFNPLVQLSAEEQQNGRPSTRFGLGLFIAREITVAHGGTIAAESDEASGTVFTVRLPRVRPASS